MKLAKKQEIDNLYKKILKNRIDGFRYEDSGKLGDVVWSIIDTETFVAGIADNILSNHPSALKDIVALKEHFFDGTYWRCDDGTSLSINDHTEITS